MPIYFWFRGCRLQATLEIVLVAVKWGDATLMKPEYQPYRRYVRKARLRGMVQEVTLTGCRLLVLWFRLICHLRLTLVRALIAAAKYYTIKTERKKRYILGKNNGAKL